MSTVPITTDVERFYAFESGWRMFDTSSLTSVVNSYLCAERELVTQYLRHQGMHTDEFIEVGCGYGRYLPLVLAENINYCGIDLVKWLVTLGKVRLALCAPLTQQKARIEAHSADHLRELLQQNNQDASQRFCVLFPFNCFGNMSSPRRVLQQLAGINVDIIISGFLPDEANTRIRRDYYEKCGCRNLSVSYSEQGTTIISEDGLHSLAYHPDSLEKLLAEFGFALRRRCRAGTCAEVAIFSPAEQPHWRDEHILCGFTGDVSTNGLMRYLQSPVEIVQRNARQLIVRSKTAEWRCQSIVWLGESLSESGPQLCGIIANVEPDASQENSGVLTIDIVSHTTKDVI